MNIFVRIYFVFVALAAFVLQGCKNENPDQDLEDALALAGSNRMQLESVISHYTGDSLKCEAAKFLIRNMPGHYSFADTNRIDYFYDCLDSLTNAMADSSCKAIQQAVIELYWKHKVDGIAIDEDVKVITADFLIDNIDKAFRQWREMPWAVSLDFDQFCEYILPYKATELQELRPWRDCYASFYADSLERMSSCSLLRISAFHATEVVNQCLRQYFKRDRYDYSIPQLFYRPLSRLNIPFGTCDEHCNAGLNIFRAAGIPCVIDYVPLWGYGNRGHSWAAVHAPNGRNMAFVPIHVSPYVQHKINETVSKAYRRTYAHNDNLKKLNETEQYVPNVFKNIFQKDVTSEYADTRDLVLKIEDNKLRYVYLCTTSRAEWRPVAYAKVEKGLAKFSDIGKGCVYMLASYGNDGLIPLDNPFKIERNGDYSPLIANHDRLISAVLYRKSPLLEYAWNMAVKSENGQFEASNTPDFTQYVAVGNVDTSADKAGELCINQGDGGYRYWRYVSRGDSASCFIGEISFYKECILQNKEAEVISNITAITSDPLSQVDRAFDGDVLTSVSFVEPREAWVGLDFGKKVSIDMIRYSPRSDGNMIEPGDEYEMMYWDNAKWNSLGRRVAETVYLKFENVPTNTMYVLHNRTKGSSVRVFLLDSSGTQEWW